MWEGPFGQVGQTLAGFAVTEHVSMFPVIEIIAMSEPMHPLSSVTVYVNVVVAVKGIDVTTGWFALPLMSDSGVHR
jgi:hypothetical protein